MRKERDGGRIVLWPETDSECDLSTLEREIGRRILGEDPRNEIARRQFDSASVVSREFSSIGAFTNLSIADPELDPAICNEFAGPVYFRCQSAPSTITAFFLGGDGALSTIELYNVSGEDWPLDAVEKVILGEDRSVQFESEEVEPENTNG